MSLRGTGDEGLAQDLSVLAAVPLWPQVDQRALAELLERLESELSDEERASTIRQAREIAGGHPDAVWLLESAISATA